MDQHAGETDTANAGYEEAENQDIWGHLVDLTCSDYPLFKPFWPNFPSDLFTNEMSSVDTSVVVQPAGSSFNSEMSQMPNLCNLDEKKDDGTVYLDTANAGAAAVEPAAKRFKCGQCIKSFGQKGHLSQHMLIHQSLKSFSCPTCTKFFRRESFPNYIKCPSTYCGSGWKVDHRESFGLCITQGNLKRHQLAVHECKKEHTCSTCGTDFGHKTILGIHEITVHEKLKPHMCSICGKTYANKGTLWEHVRIVHQGKKDHVCSICGRAFGHKNDMTRHLRIHDGIKFFNCSECPKAFSHKSNLTVHMRIHEKERPFVCPKCDNKTFSQKTVLEPSLNEATHVE